MLVCLLITQKTHVKLIPTTTILHGNRVGCMSNGLHMRGNMSPWSIKRGNRLASKCLFMVVRPGTYEICIGHICVVSFSVLFLFFPSNRTPVIIILIIMSWLHNPCRLLGPHRFRAGGGDHTWTTSGQGGYITPAACGVPTASKPGAESEVAHKWARWLHNPCRLGGPHRLRAGGRIRSGPQVGNVAT